MVSSGASRLRTGMAAAARAFVLVAILVASAHAKPRGLPSGPPSERDDGDGDGPPPGGPHGPPGGDGEAGFDRFKQEEIAMSTKFKHWFSKAQGTEAKVRSANDEVAKDIAQDLALAHQSAPESQPDSKIDKALSGLATAIAQRDAKITNKGDGGALLAAKKRKVEAARATLVAAKEALTRLQEGAKEINKMASIQQPHLPPVQIAAAPLNPRKSEAKIESKIKHMANTAAKTVPSASPSPPAKKTSPSPKPQVKMMAQGSKEAGSSSSFSIWDGLIVLAAFVFVGFVVWLSMSKKKDAENYAGYARVHQEDESPSESITEYTNSLIHSEADV